ncbi:MAG: putative nucleic acid-binding Zn-ribbon protein [Limisphaerales bacterium]|jgi:predicted  nucleic acid-binding Zn-ribbon protein
MAVKEYTVEDKLIALFNLQDLHSKQDEIGTLKGELPIEVNDLEDEIEGLETRSSKLAAEIDTIKESVSSKKIVIKDAKEQVLKYEEQKNNVKNSREFDALTKEIEMQNLEVQLAEKRIKDADRDFDAKKSYLAEATEAINAKKADLEAKKGELEKIIAETEKEERGIDKKLKKASGEVDDRLLAAFQRIRTSYKNGLAVVTIARDSCGGCFSKVPPQRKLELRQRKKIIVCEHCGRILVDSDIAGIED